MPPSGPLIAGPRSTFDDQSTLILDLKDGLDYLDQEKHGVKLLKWFGLDGFTFANHQHFWTETQLATREETITITNVATTLTVANANQYQKNCLLLCEDEVMRVTAIASATTLTVTRGYAGTTAVAHTAKKVMSMGSADPEGDDQPKGIANKGERFWNYDQTFTRAVALTNDEIAKLSTQSGEGGSPLNHEIEMRMIEIMRELARAVFYGKPYEDTTNEIYTMGGIRHFIETNIYNVGGAVSVSGIDLGIYDVLKAGGVPKLIGCHPKQKQKLDALDANLVRLGLKKPADNTGGNPVMTTWRSGLMDNEVPIVSDWTFKEDELWIMDTDFIEVGHKSHNGVVGNFHVVDSTPNGADREERTIRGKYSTRVKQEKAHAVLYNLT